MFNLNLPSPVNAKLFQVETQGIFSVKDTSAHPRTTRLDELDFDERMVPRTSPRVRPVDHPTFDEPSASRVPSQLMTPNNMSSFIEMLNYNSDTETDPNEHGKSTLTLTPQAGLHGDTTQDFIKEALADLRTTVDKHTKPLHGAGSRQKAMGQPERLARRGTTQMFSNIDDDMKLHERCAFAGLNFLRPIKHSARMVLPDPPVTLKLGGLRPLVDAAKPGNCVLAS